MRKTTSPAIGSCGTREGKEDGKRVGMGKRKGKAKARRQTAAADRGVWPDEKRRNERSDGNTTRTGVVGSGEGEGGEGRRDGWEGTDGER